MHRGYAGSGHDEPLGSYVWYRPRANAVERKVAEHPLAKLNPLDERAIADSIFHPDDKIASNKWIVLITQYIIQMDYNLQCHERHRHNPLEAVPELAAFLVLCGSIENQHSFHEVYTHISLTALIKS